jgi:short-subunit dehydrogenase
VAQNLQDRVIVITGASSGIGAATAICCAQAGMHTVLAARRTDRLDAVADRVRRMGRRALPVVCDVARDDDVIRLVAQTQDEFGRLDVMFANAGVGLTASVLDTTDDMMRKLFETNFYGTLRCIRESVPAMRTSPDSPGGGHSGGHVLICTSCVSEISLPYHGAYCATKAAQDSIAQALRAELDHEGIAVSSVHPITTRTEFFESAARNSPARGSKPAAHKYVVQSPDRVARSIVRCLRRPCPEVWPHLPTRFAMAICTAFPGLSARVLRKMGHEPDRPPCP